MRQTIFALSLALAVFVGAAPAAAQGDGGCARPALPPHARSTESLVPSGWGLEAQARGVLDEDQHPAVALVLTCPGGAGPEQKSETRPRLLLVALEQADGSYDVAVENQTLIPRLTADEARDTRFELGAPKKDGRVEAPGLEFHRGSLRIRLYAWFSMGNTAENDRTYTFRIKDGRLVLIGYDSSVVTYDGAAAWSIDFLTGAISLSSGADCVGRAEVVERCRYRTRRAKLKPAPLPSIEAVGNGVFFRPQDLWPLDR